MSNLTSKMLPVADRFLLLKPLPVQNHFPRLPGAHRGEPLLELAGVEAVSAGSSGYA